METVQDYLEVFQQVGGAEFLNRYPHPFLLYPRGKKTGGFVAYHTRMASRDLDTEIAGLDQEIKTFQVVVPKPDPSGKFSQKILVGRSPDRDIAIDHSTVSKRHAFIAFDLEKKAYRLGDAGSTNGTFHNGNRVESGNPILLREGHIVSFGECDFLFFSADGFMQLLRRIAEG